MKRDLWDNRASPRTQAALLEAMGEASVTTGKITYHLERPFMVIATQNPIEQEGTFLLAEAQKDRFLIRMSLGYPAWKDEKQMCERFQLRHPIETLRPVTTPERIVKCQEAVREVRLESPVCDYILGLVRSTREHPALLLGASPRGSFGLFRMAQAMAAIQGNDSVSIAQVKELAEAVLAHRLIVKAAATEFSALALIIQGDNIHCFGTFDLCINFREAQTSLGTRNRFAEWPYLRVDQHQRHELTHIRGFAI